MTQTEGRPPQNSQSQEKNLDETIGYRLCRGCLGGAWLSPAMSGDDLRGKACGLVTSPFTTSVAGHLEMGRGTSDAALGLYIKETRISHAATRRDSAN